MAEDNTLADLLRPLLRYLPSVSVNTHGITLQAADSLPDIDDFTLWRRRVEAMELLALMRLVAPSTWKILLETNRTATVYEVIGDWCAMDTYTIILSDTDDTETMQMLLDAVFAPVDDSDHSDEFRQAKAALVAQETRHDVRAACDTLRISVRLVCVKHATNQHKAIMQWHHACHGRPLRCTLLCVGHCEWYISRVGKLHQLHAQVKRGIRIDTAWLGLSLQTELSPHATNQFFTDLLGTYGAKWLEIRPRYGNRHFFERFFSKLTDTDHGATAQGHIARLSSLTLNVSTLGRSPAQRRSGLLWWIYGLFSQDARHSIQHLHQLTWIGSQPYIGDLRWVVRLLRAHRAPPPQIFLSEASNEAADDGTRAHEQWLTVPIGYPICVQHGDSWQDNALTYGDHAMTFRVLRDDPSLAFVDILVPGYGHCWVQRSETVKVETRPVVPWTFDQHTISSMNLGLVSLTDTEKRCLVELLGLVGRPIKSLHLSRWWTTGVSVPGDLDLDTLGDIVRSCPQLEVLGFTEVMVVPEALVNLYEHDHCRLHTLHISEGVFPDPANVFSFLEALGDSNRRISRTLRTLSIQLTGYSVVAYAPVRALVTAVFGMLQTNHVLRSVTIYIDKFYRARYKHEFQLHQNTLTNMWTTPVPLRSKCALLSALDTRSAVERGVVSTIFQFAADCARCEVSFCTPTPIKRRVAPKDY